MSGEREDRESTQEEGRLSGISAPFIRRPIATTLLVVAIALAGGSPR